MENNSTLVNIDNMDKILVNENVVNFSRGDNIQKLCLTSDGIVEKYYNNNLVDTMPFSKLGIIREGKSLISDGYTLTLNTGWNNTLTEATMPSLNNENEISLDNAEQTKQDLQKEIKDVEEIQTLKDELEDKLDTLNESDSAEEYVLVIYTNKNNDYLPEFYIKGVEGNTYWYTKDINEIHKYSKEEAEKLADLYNKADAENPHIAKAVKFNDLDTLGELVESISLNEDNEDEISDDFPSTEDTAKPLTKSELANISLGDILSNDQISWLETNIGKIEEIAQCIKNMLSELGETFNEDEVVTSVDNYVDNLVDELK